MKPHIDASLIADWIANAKSDRGTPEKEKSFWAFERVFEMRDDADWTWEFILAALAADQSNKVMELLSAGPLEDILAGHGRMIIPRVEAEARSNKEFAFLLGGVWKSSISDDVWDRLLAVRDGRGWDGIPTA